MSGASYAALAVVTDDRFGDSEIERAVLEAAGVELRIAKCRSSAEVAAAGREADALLVNMANADAAAIEALERCRVIARYGVGLDNIDVDAAKRRGIVVANVPGYCDREVAEHALGLMLACARSIPRRDRSVREGAWNVQAEGPAALGFGPGHPGVRRNGQGLREGGARSGVPRNTRLESAHLPRTDRRRPRNGGRSPRPDYKARSLRGDIRLLGLAFGPPPPEARNPRPGGLARTRPHEERRDSREHLARRRHR